VKSLLREYALQENHGKVAKPRRIFEKKKNRNLIVAFSSFIILLLYKSHYIIRPQMLWCYEAMSHGLTKYSLSSAS